MMKSISIVCVTLGMSACTAITDFRPSMEGLITPAVAPAPPVIVPQPQVRIAKERLLAAIEGQGCELNASNVGAILTSAVITREELVQLTPQLQSEGRVEVTGSGAIRSTSANCINA